MPNRILKESAFTSDKIASLSDFEFRLWAGLITYVDDAGRGDARPAIIKGRLFALRERVTIKDIETALCSLAAKGCVSLYTVGGKPYFWFPSWSDHQRIRDSKPKYPAPEHFDKPPQLAATCGELRPEYNPNPNTNTESNNVVLPVAREGDSGFASVMSLYMDRVQALPSSSCVDLLRQYTDDLSADVVIHAINKALDDNTPKWSYIRGILQNYARDGLNSLEAVQRAEVEYQSRKSKTRPVERPESVKSQPQSVSQGELDKLREMTEKMRGGK